jgi:hypothetical protein
VGEASGGAFFDLDTSGAFVIQPSAEFGGSLLSRLKLSVNHVDVL